jgi:hypothetical protein
LALAAPTAGQRAEDGVPERRRDPEAVTVILEVVPHVLFAKPFSEL